MESEKKITESSEQKSENRHPARGVSSPHVTDLLLTKKTTKEKSTPSMVVDGIKPRRKSTQVPGSTLITRPTILGSEPEMITSVADTSVLSPPKNEFDMKDKLIFKQ